MELELLSHACLEPISLRVEPGETLALCGPSGSGKTTLLRLIAGLEPPTGGSLRLFGQPAQSLPPHRRRLAMVFQGLALWPHLTVRENLRLGGVLKDRLEPLAARLEIDRFLSRYPDQLSGGERQRVALARALGTAAELLLLDEPLSQLDTSLRARLLEVLAEEKRDRTMLYVTHNAREALRIAHRILFLEAGRGLQVGPPGDLLHRPASEGVARFFGPTNLIPGRRSEGRVITCLGELERPGPEGPVLLAVRPTALELGQEGVPFRLLQSRELDDGWELQGEVGDQVLTVLSSRAPTGDRLQLSGAAWEMTRRA